MNDVRRASGKPERRVEVSRQQRMSQVFVELADTLVAQFDVIEFLHTLADRSVELLPADAAGLMLADQRGHLQVVASSTESARVAEVFELQHEEGPCLDAFTTGEQVVNLHDDQMRARWPAFSEAAMQLGFRSTHALPMRLRDNVIGALNLFARDTTPLTEDNVALGQAMADVATIGLLQERSGREKDVLVEQLQSALNSRIVIEQAKGVLAERSQISPDEAFVVLRTYARSHGLKLTVVATQVLDNSLRPADLAAR